MSRRLPACLRVCKWACLPACLQVRGEGLHEGKVMFVTLAVQRLRKEVANYELAQVCGRDGGHVRACMHVCTSAFSGRHRLRRRVGPLFACDVVLTFVCVLLRCACLGKWDMGVWSLARTALVKRCLAGLALDAPRRGCR